MKTPWHLWVIGIVSLLWNGAGAFDYVMTVSRNASYMSSFTPEQLNYFNSFPSWVMTAWALAVWASVFGSILLLLRSGRAVIAFGVSLIGMLGTTLYTYVLSDVNYLELVGVGVVWFSLAIAIIIILLWLYARSMRQRGVLT